MATYYNSITLLHWEMFNRKAKNEATSSFLQYMGLAGQQHNATDASALEAWMMISLYHILIKN